MWQRFEKILKERNLRIADVSRGSGVPYSTFTDWKAGRYSPKRDKIEKIADFLYISPDYLEGKTDDENIYVNPLLNPDTNLKENPAVADILSNLCDLAYEQFKVGHPELCNATPDEVSQALQLYKLYQNAIPEIQTAVDSLLKSQKHGSDDQE